MSARPIDREKAEALSKHRLALRCAVGAMLRVIAGAGKPEEVLSELFDAANAARAFEEKFGHLPDPEEVRAALDLEVEAYKEIEGIEHLGYRNNRKYMWHLQQACLRLTAAELLEQRQFLSAEDDKIQRYVKRLA